jgi:hypothetical protein
VPDPKHAGHWDGDTFVFDTPLVLHDAVTGEPIVISGLSHIELEDGVTFDEVFEVLHNNPLVERIGPDEDGE